MARFLLGIIFGGIVAGVLIAAASFYTGRVELAPQPRDFTMRVPETQVPPTGNGGAGTVPGTDGSPEMAGQPAQPEASGVIVESAPSPETAPAGQPVLQPDVSNPAQPSSEGVDLGSAPASDGGAVEVARDPATVGEPMPAGTMPAVEGSPEVAALPQPTAPEPEVVGPPIEAFAATFEDSANRPLVGIVLIDEPGNRPSADSLMSLSFPLTFAVDATDSAAAEAMDYYRQAGHEVAVIVPLSAGAGPDGAEAAISGALETVPQAVAVMDLPSAEFQADRAVAGRIVEMMAASGRGFLTYARGFNSAQQIALRDNVPAALVFREIDSDAQDQASIGRFLDQAAFRAGQADRVVLVGHSRPETIAAIVEWNLGNRATMVALAPLSATLLAR